ncbi:AMP-binding protein [Desulfoscipio gibsoniae]|uniref:Acyl-CoA synthetase (AMP-forming)/AMP-acid ligase II n=1 Tax=Desulfoscipio gibsoniae DSM 7213 TaxID=767817 RepID=R4KFJ2_9FIRM|nr:AMP-binding protein [Desulfoscipio gibsoniae]AGL01364.1 acyl-CoA synthetase (AMP-forming)/AMP-acid ligase II [Desulfoscipio gibsoniae DSM 7213]
MNVPQFEIGKITIGQLVDLMAAELGDNLALAYHERDIKYSYRKFRDICIQVAKGLMALGIEKGEHVSIWANNVQEWVLTQFGSAKIGAVLVTVNTSYRVFELEYLLKQSDSTTIILVNGVKQPNEYLNIMYELCPELNSCAPGQLKCARLPKLKNVIYIGEEKMPGMYNWADLYELGKQIADEEFVNRESSLHPDEVINMQYTSGTTGFPKGVMLTHTNIIGNAFSQAECLNFTPDDCLCIPVPFFHCFGCVMGTMLCVVSGAAMAPVESFNAKNVLETVERNSCTALHGVPTMFIAELEEMEKNKYNTNALRTGIMAGSPCPIEVMKSVVNKMGASEICITYGQTEASPGITMTRATDPIQLRVSTVGRALPNVEVKIVDPETGEELLPGMQGELCTRGYHVMKGYYKMPEATAQTVDREAWLHTGDLAVMDENGYCKITGRLKDMIIRGGENIYPREIEEFLYTNPKIKDVQVVGVPSERYGEEVVAFVQLKPGEIAEEAEIKEFCNGKIARHKIPAFILFIGEYPSTASGKIQKYKLREMVTKVLGREEDAKIETA